MRTPSQQSPRFSPSRPLALLVAALTWSSAPGCGPAEPVEPSLAETGALAQAIEEDNGLTVNGLTVNGLTVNGLTVNGLTVNGLASADFTSWFQGNPSLHNQVMKYVVRCAAPAGETRSFTAPDTGATYTWKGSMGLAPDWAGGRPATVEEQQILSACLAAHVNYKGANVSVSMLGLDGRGHAIPYSATELQSHSAKEACFFGNLFNGQPLHLGLHRDPQSSSTTPRACSSGEGGTGLNCAPFVLVDSCQSYCQMDPSGTYFTSCSYGGVTYRPLTTRMRPQDTN